MDHRLTAEAEAKLNALAQRTNRGTDELLEEAVDHLVAYNEWFEERVREGVAAIERGELVSDDKVRAELGESVDPFVSSATRRILERSEW